MKKTTKIYIAGHKGMVGSAILNELKKDRSYTIITAPRSLDLRKQKKVETFFINKRPNIVINAAAVVGGVYANNTYPAKFIYDNIMIQSNIIHSSFLSNVKRLLFLGSTCIYPKAVEQPMREEALLTGLLEPEKKEIIQGTAEVLQIFKLSKSGKVAGSKVIDGEITSTSKARIIRDGAVIYDGNISSIFREKNAVKEVKNGLECGISFKNYGDFKIKDKIEAYKINIIQRELK